MQSDFWSVERGSGLQRGGPLRLVPPAPRSTRRPLHTPRPRPRCTLALATTGCTERRHESFCKLGRAAAAGFQTRARSLGRQGRGNRQSAGRGVLGASELQLVQAGVEAALGDQLVVAALFDKATALQDQDAIGGAHGAEAMRNDQRGAAAEQLGERALQP